MNADLLIHLAPDGRFLLAFRLLGDRMVGRWFPAPFKAEGIKGGEYLKDWQSWDFLDGEDLKKCEKAETNFKLGKGTKFKR